MNILNNLKDFFVTSNYSCYNDGNTDYKVPNPAKVNSPERALWFLQNIKPSELPRITENQLIQIVGHVAKTVFKPKTHLEYLEYLEKGLRISGEFTLEKTSRIYREYIESLQKEQKFEINEQFQLNQKTWITPVGFAALLKAPALLNVLIQSGGNVNCGQRGSEFSSPFHLIFVKSYEEDSRKYHHYSCLDKRWWHNYDFSNLTIECINVLKQHQGNPNAICKTKLLQHSNFSDSCIYGHKLTRLTSALWIPVTGMINSGFETKEIKALVDAKADLDFRNNGETPLSLVAKNVSMIGLGLHLMKFLVESGADVLVSNDERWLDEITKRYPDAHEYIKEKLRVRIQKDLQNVLLEVIPVRPLAHIVLGYMGVTQRHLRG